jgi:hypothetical protein
MLGAEFNYYEYIHRDFICTQQLYLEELNVSMSTVKGLNWREVLEMKRDTNSLNLAYHPFAKDLLLSLLSNEYKTKNIYDMMNSSVEVMNNINKKIKFEHKINPLRIFWVKADYLLVVKIIALISSMFSIFFIFVMKNSEIINNFFSIFY